MGPPLKVGLVGCGHHSTAHVQALLALSDLVRVTAVCDVDPERAGVCGARLHAERVFTDYHEFLAESGVDAVDLCLPHSEHAPTTVEAARAGKHVLVEKPIARTLAEADAMIEAARSAGVTLMVAHNQRFHPENQRIRNLLDEDTIGRIYCARADHNQDFQPPSGHWIRLREPAGGGAMIGYGVHRIDLLRWFVGEVEEVASFQVVLPGRLEGEASAVAILRFAGGAIGEIAINWSVRHAPWMDMLYLYGDSGSIHNIGGLHLDSERRGGRVDVPSADPFTEQIRHFVRCVLDGREPLTNGRDARRTLEVCLAAYESERIGRVVRLPLSPVGSTG